MAGTSLAAMGVGGPPVAAGAPALLMEDGAGNYILLESGDKILLE